MFMGVKPSGRTLAATGVPGPTHSRLFHVTDKVTGTRFLVDTGSEVSVLPPSFTDRKHPPDKLTLTAVNHTPISTYGTRSLTLNLGLRRSFPWIFIIADVQKPIIGADFLRHFGLMVNMRQCQLTDASTHLRVQGILSSDTSPSPSILPPNSGNPFHAILADSQMLHKCAPRTVLSNTMSLITSRPPDHQYLHVPGDWHQSVSN